MSSVSPWAVVPEAEGVVAKVEGSVVEKLAHKEHDQLRVDETPGHSVLDSSDDGEKIHTLARRLTEHSIKSNEIGHVNPFNDTDNPLLNPLSEKFSPRAWMKALIGIQSRDPERYPSRVAGVAYKNLSAHGFGEATDYQKVSSFPYRFATFWSLRVQRPGASRELTDALRRSETANFHANSMVRLSETILWNLAACSRDSLEEDSRPRSRFSGTSMDWSVLERCSLFSVDPVRAALPS
jgi:hypothetical protein